MAQPLFDFDLKRVSHQHNITGKAAINSPHPGSTTGGWHFLSYFIRESGVAKASLAGIHFELSAALLGVAAMFVFLAARVAIRGTSARARMA